MVIRYSCGIYFLSRICKYHIEDHGEVYLNSMEVRYAKFTKIENNNCLMKENVTTNDNLYMLLNSSMKIKKSWRQQATQVF